MKSSVKCVGKELAHTAATTDALPQNASRPAALEGNIPAANSINTPPTVPNAMNAEQIKNIENDFRSYIQSQLPSVKAPAHLLEKIKLNTFLSE